MTIKPKRKCNRCNSDVLVEKVLTEYPLYCPECDENMFYFETHTELPTPNYI